MYYYSVTILKSQVFGPQEWTLTPCSIWNYSAPPYETGTSLLRWNYSWNEI